MIGLNSPWGYRGEIVKVYGWSYEYLLWGISWVNVQMMLSDALRTDDNSQGDGDGGEVVHRELKSKEDIKNYVKGLL